MEATQIGGEDRRGSHHREIGESSRAQDGGEGQGRAQKEGRRFDQVGIADERNSAATGTSRAVKIVVVGSLKREPLSAP